MYAKTSNPGVKSNQISVEHLGLVEYRKAWEYQREIQTGVIAGEIPNTLILLEHPSVYTAGRRTQADRRGRPVRRRRRPADEPGALPRDL